VTKLRHMMKDVFTGGNDDFLGMVEVGWCLIALPSTPFPASTVCLRR